MKQLSLFKTIKVQAVLKESIKNYLISQYKPFSLEKLNLKDKFDYYNKTFTEKLNNNTEDLKDFYFYLFIHKKDHIYNLETSYEITIDCFDIC